MSLGHFPARRRPAWRRAAGEHWRSMRFSLVVFVAAAVGATGCGSDTAATDGADQLTVGHFLAPTNLDPYGIGGTWHVNLAYDSLIYKTPDGELEPALAEKWQYIGSGNRLFEITLREGVKFSDGSDLTAQVVKDSLLRARDASTSPLAPFATFKSIQVTGPRTLRLRLSEPNPILPDVLANELWVGAAVCPKALKEPEILKGETCGAGPYTLDRSQTATGDRYTYIPNRYYWNKENVRYEKVVIKKISDPEAMLSALRTGQIDFAEGDAKTLPAAKRADLGVAGASILWFGVVLADRGGKLAPPLRDVRVRQALNYAIDRNAITKAVFPEIGKPTVQYSRPGVPGHVGLADRYPYDPARASELLEQAGYGDGFTLEVVSSPVSNLDRLAQAMAGYWEKIGVKVEIKSEQANKYFEDLISARYPAGMLGVGADHLYRSGKELFVPTAARNPFHTRDPKVESLYAEAATAPPDRSAELYAELEAYLVDQAWFVPVSLIDLFYYSRPTVTGVRSTSARPYVTLRELEPATE